MYDSLIFFVSKSSAVFCSLGDKIASVNGISFANIDHASAISVLKDSGQTATLVCMLAACLTTSVC